jgi:hypothetical protein
MWTRLPFFQLLAIYITHEYDYVHTTVTTVIKAEHFWLTHKSKRKR